MPVLSENDLVRDTYRVERLLGEGAFAEVYRVRHRFMGRQAMKVFRTPGANIADIETDLAEALLLSGWRHPNIVEVFDANVLTSGGQQYGYFTMTFMPGGTLERYWRSFGAKLMPVAEAVEVIRQTCRGLAIAHGHTPPIVHRDIKPANILVGIAPDGIAVRLSDFGLAKAVNPMTLFASSKGTLGFKPPEAFADTDSCSSDIWAIGTTLYLLLTDEMPFPLLGDRDFDDASRFLRPIRPPSLYNANVDGGLESIIYRCLASQPEDRYPNAQALLTDLDRWRPGRQQTDAAASQSSEFGKSIIPARSDHDLHVEAATALREALRLAADPARLMAAADLLEEAISKDPELRERYDIHLKLWRKGIMHAATTRRRR